ncbi:MAG: hypothetical protein MJ099_04415 [Clostridia bacterium]|nr:hypothetical protein [Clostridia bacterium]
MKTKKFNARIWACRIGAVLLLLAIAAVMLVIGRGHTVYFDNKTLETESGTYEAIRKITVNVGGERVAKLGAKERGMATTIGQSITFELVIQREKNGDEETVEYTLKLPYSMDGIIVNLPALLEGQPEEVYLSEFIPAPEPVTEEDEELPGEDEMDMVGDI